jgi:predicted permease
MTGSGFLERMAARGAGKNAQGHSTEPSVDQGKPSISSGKEGIQMLDTIVRDLVIAVRSLRRNPIFALAAMVTLALGIGATTSIFSVVHGVLLTPLPFEEPDRLATIYSIWPDKADEMAPMSKEDLRDFLDLSALDAVVGYRAVTEVLTGNGEGSLVGGARVTSGILAAFGLEPFLGRDLRFEESFPGAAQVVVISHSYWQNELGADPDALGRTLEILGATFEIVGVAPPGFDYPDRARLWRPLVLDPAACGRSCHTYWVVARLSPTATLETAAEQTRTLGDRLAETYPDSNQEKRFRIKSLEEEMVGDVRAELWVLLGAVGLVLLVACANVANLLLARAQGRVEEIGVRAALGASRTRLTLQVLTESLVLAGLGGAAGLGLAFGGVELLRRISAGAVPRIEEIGVNGPVLLFTVVLAFGVAMVFGLVPAMKLARSSPSAALGRSRLRGAAGRRSERSRNALLAAEMGLSVVLLVGAGLLLRTMGQLNRIQLGYQTENTLMFDLILPAAEYDDLPKITQFFGELEERIQGIPGVASVGSAYGAPLRGWGMSGTVRVEGRPEPEPEEETETYLRTVTPTFLETMGIRVLEGRGIETSDDTGAMAVAVVNETFVRQNFPGQNPIGGRVRVHAGFSYSDPVYTIVGVVPDVRSNSLAGGPAPEVYAAHNQVGPEYLTVAVRSNPGAPPLLQAIRAEVQAMDSDLPLRNISTMQELVDGETASTRFFLILLGVFAAMAVMLAAVGLYGVVAYLVSGRRQEIGIRLALGADRREVVGLVLLQAASPTLVGLGLGLAAALAGARIMEGFLFQVAPRDPMVFAGVATILMAVAFLAALIPARQASRLNPVQALNAE